MANSCNEKGLEEMIAREMGKRWQALSCFRAFGPFPAKPERHFSVPTPLVGGPQTGCSSPVKPSNSPLRARRRASMRSGAQEVRLARVRVRTLSPSRKDSRKRMAGGELRLGTAVIYMSVCISSIGQFVKKKFAIYMTTL